MIDHYINIEYIAKNTIDREKETHCSSGEDICNIKEMSVKAQGHYMPDNISKEEAHEMMKKMIDMDDNIWVEHALEVIGKIYESIEQKKDQS